MHTHTQAKITSTRLRVSFVFWSMVTKFNDFNNENAVGPSGLMVDVQI